MFAPWASGDSAADEGLSACSLGLGVLEVVPGMGIEGCRWKCMNLRWSRFMAAAVMAEESVGETVDGRWALEMEVRGRFADPRFHPLMGAPGFGGTGELRTRVVRRLGHQILRYAPSGSWLQPFISLLY